MGFILIGLALAAVLVFLIFQWEPSEDATYALIIFAVIFAIAGIATGLFVNTGGYHPAKEVGTIELQNLADQTTSTGRGSIFYVSISATNAYTFYTEVDSSFKTEGSKAYESRTVSKNVTVVEEEDCSYPRLTEYYQDPVITFWSFGLDSGKTSYVFYVPKGTIVHEYVLGQ